MMIDPNRTVKYIYVLLDKGTYVKKTELALYWWDPPSLDVSGEKYIYSVIQRVGPSYLLDSCHTFVKWQFRDMSPTLHNGKKQSQREKDNQNHAPVTLGLREYWLISFIIAQLWIVWEIVTEPGCDEKLGKFELERKI